ncbi:helix-turn-helix domain-containing protein [Flagellimonas marinaquae]|uniref:helix-turn-helix domain-containing protein n=1 Tax=Flagellimonas marinaquae TaxID=254955 RepID=UPI0020763930|nr:helix-turn-helix domain-containing protein [Allomuricauda aquimarina]USD24571.1 hypothetical protein MJO53_12905 [Allomuricauda aquimarina]
MLRFNLKQALLDYQAKTGLKLSYEELSKDTDISVETLKSIATREEYNATFRVISLISISLGINPIDYFEWKTNDRNR